MRSPVALFLTLLLALVACNSADPAPGSGASPAAQSSAAPTQPGKPARAKTASCGSTRTVAEQSGSHLVGDNEPPVPYNSTPPTSGWHSSGAVEIGVRGAKDPLTEPEQVSVLEAGGVVVSYGDLPKRQVAQLERLARGNSYDGTVAVTPYDKLRPGRVAATAWAKLLLCKGVDVKSLRRFVDQHAGGHTDTPGH